VTVVSDDNVEAAIGQFFGDQCCCFAIIFDAQNFFAWIRHPTSLPK